MNQMELEQQDNTDTTTDGALISVVLTEKGADNFLNLLQDHVGYVEEECREALINDVNKWFNVEYGEVLEFFIKARTNGTVTADQHCDVIKELNNSSEIIKQLRREKKSAKDKSDRFKDIENLTYLELREVAKDLGIHNTKLKKINLLKSIQEHLKTA